MGAPTVYVLRQDGRELARHSTRIACAIEAVERKLAVRCRRFLDLLEGVSITEERSDA